MLGILLRTAVGRSVATALVEFGLPRFHVVAAMFSFVTTVIAFYAETGLLEDV